MKTSICQYCAKLFTVTAGSYRKFCSLYPKIISHPANCQIIPHSQNKKKHTKCNISVSELEEKIKQWNKKYTEQATGIEPATNSLEG